MCVMPHWLAKITGTPRSMATLAGIAPESGPTWPSSQCLRTRFPIREIGPRRRHHRHVDLAAIITPDLAVNHVGADGKADSSPRSLHNQRRSPGMEPEPLPEHQVPLAVNLHVPVGTAKNQRIVQMPAFALDETSRNRHPPLAAALPQMTKRRPFCCLAIRTKVRAEAVTRVEQLRQDRQLDGLESRADRNSSSARSRLAETSSTSEGIWTAATTIFTAVHPVWKSISRLASSTSARQHVFDPSNFLCGSAISRKPKPCQNATTTRLGQDASFTP